MRRIALILVAGVLLAGTVSCTAPDNKREMYQYYMQIAQQYEVAAAAEESRADYYFRIADGLKSEFTELSEEQYEEMVALGNNHQENVRKYSKVAEQNRAIARQYR